MDAQGPERWRGSLGAWEAAGHVGGRQSEGAVAEYMRNAAEVLLAKCMAGISSGEAEKLGEVEVWPQ